MPGSDDTWTPPAIDPNRPSVARIYDYGLGGKDNYAVDREVAERFMAVIPDTRAAARANRGFLTRVVTSAAQAGLDQFVDLGTGIPTSPNVHETARAVHPDAAVVYVDNDPIVLAHNRALLRDDTRVTVLSNDLRDAGSVLDEPTVRDLLDFGRPVALLLIAVLHFVDVPTGRDLVARYLAHLAPGSRLAISALSSHGIDPEVLRKAEQAYGGLAAPLVYRSEAELAELFDGLEWETPLADVYRSPTAAVLGGVGVKR